MTGAMGTELILRYAVKSKAGDYKECIVISRVLGLGSDFRRKLLGSLTSVFHEGVSGWRH
ncbi:hypothetical protein QO003_003593 [Arthrobacter silviterrae]|nr:hypothetical protein [Arthrobacter silviterrae]